MSCYHPLRARRDASGLRFLTWRAVEVFERDPELDRSDILLLPCGRCIGCKVERGSTWAMRIMHEASLHDVNSFVTLTYSDEHLPYGDVPTLDGRDLQLLWKRMRKNEISFRYFACGEYGSETGRPHYHAILFGWRPELRSQVTSRTYDSAELAQYWYKGGSTVGEVNEATAAYVAQYALKKMYGKRERELGRKHEFITMSKGIGRGWLEKYSSDLDRGYVQTAKKKVRLPRYYRQKKGEAEPEWLVLQEERAEKFRAELDPEEQTRDRLLTREMVFEGRRKFFESMKREPSEVRNA